MGYHWGMRSGTGARDAHQLSVWDGFALFWVVFWLVVGGWVGYAIWQLTGLSSGMLDSARALDTAGRALTDLAGVPVIGDRTGELGGQVATTAASIKAGAVQADGSIRSLAVLIGTALGIGPSSPVLFVYVPQRLAWRAESRAAARAVADPATRPAAMAALARRAMTTVPLERLLRMTPDPEADLAVGRYEPARPGRAAPARREPARRRRCEPRLVAGPERAARRWAMSPRLPIRRPRRERPGADDHRGGRHRDPSGRPSRPSLDQRLRQLRRLGAAQAVGDRRRLARRHRRPLPRRHPSGRVAASWRASSRSTARPSVPSCARSRSSASPCRAGPPSSSATPTGLDVFVQAESVLDGLSVNQQKELPYPLLGAIPVTNSVRLMGSESEANTSVLTYLFMNPTSSFASQREGAQRYIDTYLDRPEDHVVGVAGSVPARAEQASLVEQNLPRLELFTVLAIIVLVAFTFRSIVAPLIALVASAISFDVTLHLSEMLGSLAGFATPAELEPLLVALLLGVVTDYTIFYVTALQSRITTMDWRDAVRDAVATDTPIVAAAGITVAAGTAALLAADSEFFRGFGPAMALAVVVGLCVSVTLVPAALAILGPKVFWPRDPHRTRAPRTDGRPARVNPLRRLRIVERLASRKVAALVVLACVGLLVVASSAVRHLDLGVGFTSSLPDDSQVSRATEAASDAFAPGITSPTTVLIEQPGVAKDLDALAAFQHRIEDQQGVAGVIGPAQNVTGESYNVVLSPSGNTARMLVVLDNDPLDATAIDDLGLAARPDARPRGRERPRRRDDQHRR